MGSSVGMVARVKRPTFAEPNVDGWTTLACAPVNGGGMLITRRESDQTLWFVVCWFAPLDNPQRGLSASYTEITGADLESVRRQLAERSPS